MDVVQDTQMNFVKDYQRFGDNGNNGYRGTVDSGEAIKVSNSILDFLKIITKRALIREIKESAIGYITNKTKTSEIFQSWSIVLNSDKIRTIEEMEITLIYATKYLKSVPACEKQSYESEGTEENKMWNFNRVLLRLESAINKFMDQRPSNWFINGDRRLVNISDINQDMVISKSEELRPKYVQNEYYQLRCGKNWDNNRECLEILTLYLRLACIFIIAVESPAKYGLLSSSAQGDTTPYKNSIDNYKERAFEYFLMLRARKFYKYFEEFIENNVKYFWELLRLVIAQTETINTFFSKLPSYIKDLHQYAVIGYEMSTNTNKGKLKSDYSQSIDFFEYIRRYESILGVDDSYSDGQVQDLSSDKHPSIMIIGYRELIYTLTEEISRLQSVLNENETEEAVSQKNRWCSSYWAAVEIDTMSSEEKEEAK